MKYLFIALFFAGALSGTAQESETIPYRQWGLSYFGETFSHPGFSLTYDRYMKSWYRPNTTKKGKVKDKVFVGEAGFLAGFYNHKRNHFASFVAPTITINRIKMNGGYSKMGFFLGGMVKTINAPVYDLTNGPPGESKYSTSLGFLGGFRLGIGRDLSIKNPKIPLKIGITSSLFISGPFSTSFIWQNAIEFGLIWKFS